MPRLISINLILFYYFERSFPLLENIPLAEFPKSVVELDVPDFAYRFRAAMGHMESGRTNFALETRMGQTSYPSPRMLELIEIVSEVRKWKPHTCIKNSNINALIWKPLDCPYCRANPPIIRTMCWKNWKRATLPDSTTVSLILGKMEYSWS